MILITFIDGLLFSLLSITLVILSIGLIIIVISPLRKISNIKQDDINSDKSSASTEILDEDMLVALLVASIDYLETTKKEPHLESIREIKE
jgi:hypothetical protein